MIYNRNAIKITILCLPRLRKTFLEFLTRYLWIFSAVYASRTQGKIPRLVDSSNYRLLPPPESRVFARF